jgi:drug/metabolite transporter (DMT)-like permease
MPADLYSRLRDFLKSPAVRGPAWMMLSALGWTMMMTIARALKDDFHTFEIVFFRSIFAAIFFIPWLYRTRLSGLRTRRVPMLLLRGISTLIALYLLFGALVFSPMADVAAITFTRPLLASIGAVIFLGEVARGHRWTATLFGLIGALIIIRPGLVETSLGQLMAIGATIGMVISSLAIKSLARTEHPDTIAIYQIIMFTTLSIIPAMYVWVTPTPEQWGLALLLGFSAMLTQRAMTRSYKVADATAVLPFEYTRLPFTALAGLVLFGEFPDGWTWAGGTVIFIATLYMMHREARIARDEKAKIRPDEGGGS